jgi:hypothetical protein
MAASILDAAGRTVVAVDDDYDHAAAAGVPAVSDRVVGGQASAGANPCTPAPTAPAGD